MTEPLLLLEDTEKHGSVYRESSKSLALPVPTVTIPLTASQQSALRLGLSSSPLVVIQGVPGCGKKCLARLFAETAVSHEQEVLILARYETTLGEFNNLSGIICNIMQSDNQIKSQLRMRCFGKLPMNFLPLYLLPDTVLAELRSPQELVRWLSYLEENISEEKLLEYLQQRLPTQSHTRLKLLAYRIHQLKHLLETQLWLSQQAEYLSDEEISDLSLQMQNKGVLVKLGLISDYLTLQSPRDSNNTSINWMIVLEAETLNWQELHTIAANTDKLILLGTLSTGCPLKQPYQLASPLVWLGEYLLPTYRYRIHEQFRLSSTLAQPIYNALYHTWIHSHSLSKQYHFKTSLLWLDVRGENTTLQEIRKILNQFQRFNDKLADNFGIITISLAQKEAVVHHFSDIIKKVKVGTVSEWAGQERSVVAVMLGTDPNLISFHELEIALTRARNSLILTGNRSQWLKTDTPIQNLLSRNELLTEREVNV